MNEQDALNVFLALSNATRLRMLKCLVTAGSTGMIAGDVAKTVDASPSRASFHLTAMSDAGLITATKQSRQITYAVDFDTVGQLVRYLMEDCCQNNGAVMACCGFGGDGVSAQTGATATQV